MTSDSLDVMSNWVGLFTGRTRVVAGRPLGYVTDQANWRPVTLTIRRFAGLSSFFTSTTPPAIAKATTMTVGSSVQPISRLVWPWIGSPSLSSSPGRARNLHTEYTRNTVTMAMMNDDM